MNIFYEYGSLAKIYTPQRKFLGHYINPQEAEDHRDGYAKRVAAIVGRGTVVGKPYEEVKEDIKDYINGCFRGTTKAEAISKYLDENFEKEYDKVYNLYPNRRTGDYKEKLQNVVNRHVMYHKSDLDYDITKLQEDNGYEDLYLYCIREDGTNIFSLRNALEFKNPTLASYIRVNKHFYVIKILDRNLNIERIK